jgi:hypothetical protein
MSLSQLAAAAKAAATPPTAAPVEAEPAETVVAAPSAGALAIFTGGAPNMGAALNQALSVAGGSGAATPFPILDVPYKQGMFVAPEFQEEAIRDRLPEGRKPIDAVFIGLRLDITAWPKAYDSAQSEPDQPAYSAAIPLGSGDVGLAMKACKAYQFTPKADKGKFDFDPHKAGHVRPQATLLVWSKAFGDLILVRTTQAFGSVAKTLENLGRLVDPATGALSPFPGAIRVVTESATSRASGETWQIHSLMVQPSTNTQAGADMWAEYNQWLAAAASNAEVVTKVSDWLNGVDRPMTDEIRGYLHTVARYAR